MQRANNATINRPRRIARPVATTVVIRATMLKIVVIKVFTNLFRKYCLILLLQLQTKTRPMPTMASTMGRIQIKTRSIVLRRNRSSSNNKHPSNSSSKRRRQAAKAVIRRRRQPHHNHRHNSSNNRARRRQMYKRIKQLEVAALAARLIINSRVNNKRARIKLYFLPFSLS